MNKYLKGTCPFFIGVVLLLFNIGCSHYNGVDSPSSQSNPASETHDSNSPNMKQESNNDLAPDKFDQFFQYDGLTLKLTDIKEIKQSIATDDFETWEYDIYVVYPGATMSIANENDVAESSVELDYFNLRFFTPTYERIPIVDDMVPVEITDDILGIVDGDANAWIIAFELCSED